MNLFKTRNIGFFGLLVPTAILLAGSGAQAQVGRMPQSTANPQNTPNTSNAGGNMPDTTSINTVSDSDFAKDAAEGGMIEVKLGQLAQEKGSNDAVKEFGKRMVDDHSAANDKLKGIASQESMRLPMELNKHDESTYDKLSKLSGADFDRAYARDMVKDHQNDVSAFEQEASNGRDPEIKTFASDTLPTLQDHLKMAREMMRTVGSSSAAKNGSGQ
jgi:putative membrane protein